MADGTITNQPAVDNITAIDILKMDLRPTQSILQYTLRYTLASGKNYTTDGVVLSSEFNSCLASFCSSGPKKKFLQWLLDNGHETNITPT